MRTTSFAHHPHRSPPPVTDETVYAALIRELDRLDELRPDDLHRLAPIRRRLPGTWDQQLRAVHDAVESGDVALVRVNGSPLVQRGDDTDREFAALCRSRGRHPAHWC
jgi:hypothetical protein